MRAAEDLASALRQGRAGLWERLWFGEGPLVRLAVFRIVVLADALFALSFHRMSLVQGDAGHVFVTRRFVPLYFLELLGIGPMDPGVARVLYVVLFALILLGILGLFTRVVCALVAAGMLLWTGTAYSYGQPHHEYGLLAFALCSLPFGPVGERLSLDSLRARWRKAARERQRMEPPVYGENALLPIRFVQLTAALGYFFAGITKLRIGGVQWMNGYTLQGFMLRFDAPLTDWLAEQLLVLRVMSVGVILIQVLCVIAVIWRPSRWFFVPGIVGLHLGSMLAMDTGTFLGLWLLQAAFVDFEKLPGFLHARIARGWIGERALWLAGVLVCTWFLVAFYVEKGPSVVPWLFLPVGIAGVLGLLGRARGDLVFDGGCGICMKTIAVVDALNWSGRVRMLDATRWDEVVREHGTKLSQDEVFADIHFVDARGRVFRGFEAYRKLAWRLPITVLIAPLLYLPGVPAVGKRVYRHVADGRLTTSCGVDPAE